MAVVGGLMDDVVTFFRHHKMSRNNLEEVFLPVEILDKNEVTNFRWITFFVGQNFGQVAKNLTLLAKEKSHSLSSLTLLL